MEDSTNTISQARSTLHLGNTFVALRHYNFRLFWYGQLISLIGTWMQSVAQGWLVLQLTNSPFFLGLVGAARALPILFFTLFGGVVADRVNKRILIIGTQSASMLLALLLAVLTSTGHIRVWDVLIVAFLLGTVDAFDRPARQAFVVEMVGKEDLMNAIALNSSVMNGARIVGPALAGVLVSLIGVAGCFYLNGVSFLAVIAGLLLMRLAPSSPVKQGDSVWQNILEGVDYIYRDSALLPLVILVALVSIFCMPYSALMPVFARDILHAGATGLGLLMSAAGLGALTGALSLAALGNFRHKGYLLLGPALALSLALSVFSLSHWLLLSLVALVAVGWSMMTYTAVTSTLLQTMVPDRLRGRVMSVYTFMFSGMTPLGNLQAGIVAEYWGAPFAILLGALLCGLLNLLVHRQRPYLRRLS
ncbi:MAG: MFS transporter [Chloroflexi bacterium]|nr:MFS transporter [Chloroflexota bacterium]MCL5074882.1 MFS transporter [Chloroflexota bacterium]